MKYRIFIVLLLGGAFLVLREISPPGMQQLLPKIQTQIREQLTLSKSADKLIWEAYVSHDFIPKWISQRGLRPQASDLIEALEHSIEEGLNPEEYQLRELQVLVEQAPQLLNQGNAVAAQQIAFLDCLLTRVFFRFAGHLLNGRINPGLVDPFWGIYSPPANLIPILEEALGNQGVEAVLRDLLPMDQRYGQLKNALQRYQQYELQGFHHAPSDNVTVAKRIDQIKANMERWRWLPQDLGERYVWVNVPEYSLAVIENHQVLVTMNAIVGKEFTQTPSVASVLNEIVLNPYWNIPKPLAVRELLPLFQRDPGYIRHKHIRVFEIDDDHAQELDSATINWSQFNDGNFPYSLKQDPGPQNALGQIVFLFANHYALSLHDTPNRSLFDEHSRAFSSGCIRIGDPQTLALYLLKDYGWDQTRLLRELRTWRTQSLIVAAPIYILYFTVGFDRSGQLHFWDDIYARDKAIIAVLKSAS